MKHLKILGLAVVAAAALTALVGAGSASATTLCKANEKVCSPANTLPIGKEKKGTLIQAQLVAGTKSVLKAGFATVECSESPIGFEAEETGTTYTSGAFKTLTFVKCNTNAEKTKEGCVVAILFLGALDIDTDIKGTANGNGKLVGTNTETTINCSGVSCKFGTAAGAGTELGTITGGEPAKIAINAKLPWLAGDSSNAICTLGTGTGTWTVTYTITNPKPLFIE